MSKFVGTEPLSYGKKIYRAAVSQRLRNTDIYHCSVHNEETPDDGQRNCPKHAEFLFQK